MMLHVNLKGKVVCVTGSARRVGRRIMLELARQGASVVIHHSSSDADAEDAAEEARAFGVETCIVKANQADPAQVKRMFNEIREHFGRVDILVNSAATFKRTPFLDIPFDEWQFVMNVNLNGPFLCTQEAAKLMIEAGNGGVIVNISDNSGLTPWQARPNHSVSKAAVLMLTQVSALSLAEHGIRVNCVVPGPVLRPAGEPESVLDDVAAALPVGHIGSPLNIAQACLFMVANDFMTGTIMRVDGGEGIAGGQT